MSGQTSNKALIAVPCFNEMEAIRKTILEIIDIKKTLPNTDLLVVDDGSTDDSVKSIEDLGIVIIKHSSNLGLGESFKTAVDFMLAQGYEYLITIDADGQFLASEIPKFLEIITGSKWGLVTGSRFLPESKLANMPTSRKIGNKVYVRILQTLTRAKITDVSCGFRAYNREALLNIDLKNNFTYTHETIMQLTQAQVPMKDTPITVEYFKNRESKISGSLIKYGYQTLKIILKTTLILKPVQTFLSMASLFSFPGAYFGYIFIENKIRTGSFQGYLYAGISSGFLFILFLLCCMFAGVSAVFMESNRKLGKILYLTKLTQYKNK
jgi:glycosyltransferase involved in cell wall biosynthesis